MKTISLYCATACLTLLFLTSTLSAEFRNFTDTRGRVIHACLVSFDGERVTLRNETGKEVLISISSLSDADQVFVRRYEEERVAIVRMTPFQEPNRTRLVISGLSNRRYPIERSPDLQHWMPIGDVVTNHLGEGVFADAGVLPARAFYRVRLIEDTHTNPPNSQGIIERYHRAIGKDLMDRLASTDATYRATIQDSNGRSEFENRIVYTHTGHFYGRSEGELLGSMFVSEAGWNGTETWSVALLNGHELPITEILELDELTNQAGLSAISFEGQVTELPDQTYRGEVVHAVEVINDDGDTSTHFFDTQTALHVGTYTVPAAPNTADLIETRIITHRQIDGMQFPWLFQMIATANGNQSRTIIEFTKIELNKPFDPTFFEKGADRNTFGSDISPALLDPAMATETAPDLFNVTFETTAGDFTLEVNRSWAPKGADRFYNLVKLGFFQDIAFFRAIDNFVVQFGIHGEPAVSAGWNQAPIEDELIVRQSNTTGTLTFARSTPDSRTTQLFINLADNTHLDTQGYTPIGEVIEGMEAVRAIFTGYDDAPKPSRIQSEGNAYLKNAFPSLTYIKKAVLAGE